MCNCSGARRRGPSACTCQAPVVQIVDGGGAPIGAPITLTLGGLTNLATGGPSPVVTLSLIGPPDDDPSTPLALEVSVDGAPSGAPIPLTFLEDRHGYRLAATGTATIPATDYVVGVDTSGGNGTLTITTPTTYPYEFIIKKLSPLNTLTLTPASGTIDGQASLVVPAGGGSLAATGGPAVSLMWTGTNWIII